MFPQTDTLTRRLRGGLQVLLVKGLARNQKVIVKSASRLLKCCSLIDNKFVLVALNMDVGVQNLQRFKFFS